MFHLSESLTALLKQLREPAQQGRLGRLERGIEKEGLRVDADARVAQSPHAKGLGSKLTHPYITTDYSEALLEFVTPVFSTPEEALDFLTELHRFTYRQIGDESIWPASMPARLNGNDSVPIADYGSSNSGRMKHVYRKGLDLRYGRIMQSIAGVHYNVSLPDSFWDRLYEIDGRNDLSMQDYRSARYFDLIRNFRRHSWLLLYLFGASPALDTSFLPSGCVPEGLERHGKHTLISRYATSLRMSDLGYQNKVQAQIKICFNSLSNFVNTLRHATTAAWPAYAAKGVQVDGDWRQLNASILQIENEYYSDIRPKRVTRRGETPSQALECGGVEYIEVRCLDLDPFDVRGINATRCRFVDMFVAWCLLSESPWISDQECEHLDDNRRLVVNRGRDPELRLEHNGHKRSIADWGGDIFAEMKEVAALLDIEEQGSPHQNALAELAPLLDNPELTPSGKYLEKLLENNSEFSDLAYAEARRQAEQLASQPSNSSRQAEFAALVERSEQQQKDIEAADTQGFDEFMQDYFMRANKSCATVIRETGGRQ
ncbi:glutamate--cysteine ligase [Halomonas halocynthiae]|uniref:glutamate--cysteine ligase n=1 Tax=Halomonas halocynthiae TaxID=176290 RepID=UPI00041E1FCD|nr:glutamate--cysteine ligase [Halomonas halocynthiae]